MGARGFAPRSATALGIAKAKAREGLFLERILPVVRGYARKRFLNFPESVREEMQQEAACVAWRWFVSLCERDKDPMEQVGTIVKYVVVGLFNYRFLCGQESKNDIHARRAQEVHGFGMAMVDPRWFDVVWERRSIYEQYGRSGDE